MKPALSRLSLPFNRFGPDDAEHLFALPLLRQLQHLDLSDNRPKVRGVTALAESGIVRGLRILNLSNTRPGVPGVKALTEAGGLGGLRMLDLSCNAIGRICVKALAQCSSLRRASRALNLASNHVGDAGAAAGGIAFAHWSTGIGLRDAEIENVGAIALAESPYLENLLRLDLRSRDGRSFSKAARACGCGEDFGDEVSL